VTPQVPEELSITKSVVTLRNSHAAAGLEGRNNRRAEMEVEKKQVSNATFKCMGSVFAFLMCFFYLIFGLESCYACTTLLICRTVT